MTDFERVVRTGQHDEPTLVLETSPQAGDGYLELKLAPNSSASQAIFSATLNGRAVTYRMSVGDDGYARLSNPENGVYKDVRVRLDGREVLVLPTIDVTTRFIAIERERLTVSGEYRNVEYTGKLLRDVGVEKSNQCVNNN